MPAYQARRIATATRHLTAEQAGWVDAQLAPALGAVSWGRLETLLEAKIIEADPVGAEQQAALAAQERFVRLGRGLEHGLKLIIARATAGDAIWFKATIDRIADILARQGDTDPVEVRRSKAIGILAQPAHALQLLCRHQDDDWDGPAEPADRAAAKRDATGPSSSRPTRRPGKQAQPADQQGAEQAAARESCRPARCRPGRGDTHQSLQLTPPPFRSGSGSAPCSDLCPSQRGSAQRRHRYRPGRRRRPRTLGRLRILLGDRCTISLKPVIDLPAGHIPVDCYEIPARLREQLQLRYPADVFPYAAAVSRRIDIDHTIPYLSPDRGGPPGQTTNRQPRTPRPPPPQTAKPTAGWQVRQPEPGTWLWRSPHRRIYLVNATGTHPLGDTDYSQTIWHAAANPSPALVN